MAKASAATTAAPGRMRAGMGPPKLTRSYFGGLDPAPSTLACRWATAAFEKYREKADRLDHFAGLRSEDGPPMSALGHELPRPVCLSASALPPESGRAVWPPDVRSWLSSATRTRSKLDWFPPTCSCQSLTCSLIIRPQSGQRDMPTFRKLKAAIVPPAGEQSEK